MINISASGVKLYRGCPRRWVFAKVHRLPEPETAATTVGKKVHAELEDWVRKGQVPKHPLAAAMLKSFKGHPYWPDPRVTEAEGGFEFWLDGLHFHGFRDFARPGDSRAHRVIGDYKTCASFDFALRAEDGLLVDTDGTPDVQSAIYSTLEFISGAERVTNIWLYGRTKDLETQLVEVDADLAKTETVMREVCADGHKMVKLANIHPDANDVPFNPGYCNAFRKPCAFARACKKSEHGLFSTESDPLDVTKHPELLSMDFLSSLKQSLPGQRLGEIAPNPTQELPPPPVVEDDLPPPPPEDDDVPPPPPVDEPHPAELLAMAAVDNPPTRDLSAAVESGFVNAPEAAGKKPYANPAAAAEGEGVKAPKATKRAVKKSPADSKGFAITADTKFDSGGKGPIGWGTAEEAARLAAGGDPVVERAEAHPKVVVENVSSPVRAEDVLRQVYELLRTHFEQR